MKYTRENILNLRVRRGGETEYIIEYVGSKLIDVRHIASGRNNNVGVDFALRYLNNGKWTVVGEGFSEEEKETELTYQIY